MAEITFDFDKVTPRMLLDFKAHTGKSLLALVGDGDIDITEMDEEVIVGFIWLSLRMSDRPDATWDEALDTPFTSLSFAGDEEPPDPTSASSEN